MNVKEESDVLDCTIMVSHQVSPPTVFNAGGALEFDGEGALIIPSQKLLKDFMANVLTEFAGIRNENGIVIESRLRLEFPDETEFPATLVIRLVGARITSDQVKDYRAAAQGILSALVPQQSLGETELVGRLNEEEMTFLAEKGKELLAKFANKSVTQGFVVNFGSDELGGITIQGIMPTLISDESLEARIEGAGRLIGFDEATLKVILWLDEAANDGGEATVTRKLEALCPNENFLRILARAYGNRHLVQFVAVRQPVAGRKKSVVSLLNVAEVATNDPEFFGLD